MFPAYLPPRRGNRRAGANAARPWNRYLEELAATLRRESGINVVVDEPGSGTLSDYAVDHAADLVVMTLDGDESLETVWSPACSKSERRRPPAVLAIPPRERYQGCDPERLFRHVLVPLDGSREAEWAAVHAIELGRLGHARYTLLHVLPAWSLAGYALSDDGPSLPWSALEENEARRFLSGVSSAMRRHGLCVAERIVRHPRPASAILDVAGAAGADLIAMTCVCGKVGSPLLGDVAEEVLNGATVPVLLCRPPEVSFRSTYQDPGAAS